MADRPGYNALWLWFGLSHAGWLTLPRVMMHEMPDDWQRRMAELLNEWDATWRNQPEYGTRVQVTTPAGRLTAAPEWLTNYRYPDMAAINRCRTSALEAEAGE